MDERPPSKIPKAHAPACPPAAADRASDQGHASDWDLLVRIAWSGGRVPAIRDVLTPAVIADDAALAHVLAADLHERASRALPCSAREYLAAAPELLGHVTSRQTLFMASLSSSRARAGSVHAAAETLLSEFPQYAREIEGVAALAAAIDAALGVRPPLAPGDRRGKYELRSLLGEGTFAQTWRARDTALDRDVALKIIPVRGLRSGESTHLLAEARALARVHHDAVVTLHEAGRFGDDAIESGEVYLDMELVDAGGQPRTLAELVGERALDERASASLIALVARGLAAAHASGVLHRDVKPANILLDTDRRPRLADFGLASRSSEADSRGAMPRVVGTLAYIAPEVAAGQDATPLADIFSLGATLRTLLTGDDPRRGQSRRSDEALRHAASNPLPPVRSLAKGVHPTLAAIADRATAHAPDDRYRSALELASDLESFLADKPTLARPLQWHGRARLWFRRHAAMASVVAAAILTIVIGTIVFVTRVQAERDNARDAEAIAQRERDAAVAARDTIQAQNRFMSRAFNSARGQRGPGEVGGDASLRDSLAIVEQRVDTTFSDRPLVLASVRQFLAQGLTAIGDHARAEKSARAAIAIREQLLGHSHADSIAARCTLAEALLAQDKTSEGYQVIRSAHDDAEASGQLGTADGRWIRVWMARIDDAEGRHEHARASLGSIVEEYRDAPFDGSMDRQSALNELVTMCLRDRRYDDAARYQQEIVELLAQRYSQHDISTLYAIRTLVLILQLQSRLEDAAAVNARLLEDFRQVLPAGHRATIDTLLVQAEIELLREPRAALEFAVEAACLVEHRRPEDRVRLRAQAALGRAQREAGDLSASETTLRAAFEAALQSHAGDDLVRDIGYALETVLRSLKRDGEADQVAATIHARTLNEGAR